MARATPWRRCASAVRMDFTSPWSGASSFSAPHPSNSPSDQTVQKKAPFAACAGKEKKENVRTKEWRCVVIPKSTLTSKGQVTIPLAIREALGLSAGTQLSFELTGGELRVRAISRKTWPELWSIAAGAPRPPKPVDISAAIQAAVRERSDK